MDEERLLLGEGRERHGLSLEAHEGERAAVLAGEPEGRGDEEQEQAAGA